MICVSALVILLVRRGNYYRSLRHCRARLVVAIWRCVIAESTVLRIKCS
jgi:hypothetical protein